MEMLQFEKNVMASKRGCVPSGNSPGKPPSKKLSRDRKSGGSGASSGTLFEPSRAESNQNSQVNKPQTWNQKELAGLVQYVALFHDSSGSERWQWPVHKNNTFWKQCAEAVSTYSGKPLRSLWACRTKVLKYLKRKFKTIDEAEEELKVDYFDDGLGAVSTCSTPQAKTSGHVEAMSPVFRSSPLNVNSGAIIQEIVLSFHKLSKHQRLQLVEELFFQFIHQDVNPDFTRAFVPNDFCGLVAKGMDTLLKAKKDNLLYSLGKCFGQFRQDGVTPRLPLDRMPFGLIAHNIAFFSSNNCSRLQAPDDYKSWMETMYARFGQSWAALHLGPMWSYVDVTPQEDSGESIVDVLAVALEESGITDLCDENSSTHEESQRDSTGILSPEDSCVTSYVCESPTPTGNADLPELQLQNESQQSSEEIQISSTPLSGQSRSDLSSTSLSGDGQSFSTLWANLTAQEIEELNDAEVSYQDVEEMHGMRPKQHARPSVERDPLKGKVNVAGPSAVTIRRAIAKSGFSRNTDIQVRALKTAHDRNRNARWWIKADATDLNKGLRESMKNKWSGDVDLGDGSVERLHDDYMEQLSFIKNIGLKDHRSDDKITLDLSRVKHQLEESMTFLTNGLGAAKKLYEDSLKRSNAAEQTLFALAWEVDGYEKLKESNSTMTGTIEGLRKRVTGEEQRGNLAKDLADFRRDLQSYTKGLFGKKREAASHLLVFMISDELRNFKPYAIPVRVVAYRSITDDKVQELKEELKDAMKNIGMNVVGFVTDGEWNKIRTKGVNRPVSIIQIMMDAKEEARKTRVRTIEQYLKPCRQNPIGAARTHDAVPVEDVQWLHDFMFNQTRPVAFEDAIHILRRTHYPFQYDPHPWNPGKEETKNDCLKSLMATYLFKAKINELLSEGANFREYLYVPEKDPDTLEYQHDREDHNHVLKRIATSLRLGNIPGVDLRHFVSALNDPLTGLTYTALTGVRKQSVPDCERLFSAGVLKYMQDHSHIEEAKFVEVVRNWHKASDGRGIDEATRSSYNKAMLDWLLEDWMPWFRENRDYSTIDVNRPIKGIQGLTREVIVALVSNIESQEFRRREGATRGLPPEHPRASSTDDVEGYFAVNHEMLGDSFDLKTFFDQYPKTLNEFNKRIDPNTPFFYWTSSTEQYTLGPLSSFNKPSGQTERLDRVVLSRRADPGVFETNRASLPQHGRLTVRAQWHRVPECLPPRVVP